jgi:hypothetical protein
MQPVMEYVGQHPVTQVSVQVFPAATPSTFEYYDDNGSNYAYEQGDYFLQRIGTQRVAQGVRLSLAPAQGHYQPALRTFLFAVHGIAARAVQAAGTPLAQHASLAALQAGAAPAWAMGHDRYGPVTWLKLRAGFGQYLLLESR